MQAPMVNIYGLKLRQRRFGHETDLHLAQLLDNEKKTIDELRAYQEKSFSDLVAFATSNVPFYKRLVKDNGMAFKDIGQLANIHNLPVISKDMVRKSSHDFCAKMYLKKGKGFWLSTSGTSGKPLNILCDTVSRQRHYAFWERFRSWCGLQKGHIRATFFGRIIISPEKKRPPFWHYDRIGKNYLFSSYHLTEKNLKYYYNHLVKINPSEIIGYPSSLFILAKYCRRNKLNQIRPTAVITTAETLLAQQRALLEDVFQCPVYDQYGCTEMALFVSQCEHGSYHVHSDHGILEVLDHNNQPVEPGIAGRAVCTGFINRAMPLIRYDLGDHIMMTVKKCPCGRPFPVIREIVGRVDDILVAPDGRPLGRLDPVFKGLSGICETQIIQHSRNYLQIKMVVEPFFSNDHMKKFRYELRKRVGKEMKVNIDLVNEIPKNANGKFRAVISYIK